MIQPIALTRSQGTPYMLSRRGSACRYLASTNLSLKEISAKCGYTNQYYFSNSFKKKLGISPSVYREQQIQKLQE